MRPHPLRAILLLPVGIALVLARPGPAAAADPAGAAAGPPGLDELLKLPDSLEFSSEKIAGATRSEWRQRFHDARERVSTASRALAKAQTELADTVGSKGEWQFAPPGLPAGALDEGTANFQLRQEVKRQRAELARAQMRLRDLEVEANLAGVPESWRRPDSDSNSDYDGGTPDASAR